MKRRSLVLASLVVALAAAGALGFGWPFATPPRPLQLGGVVEVQEVGLGPKVAGRIGQVLVKEGEVVEPGQVLLTLDAPELSAQVRQARARACWKKLVAGAREEDVRQARGDVACA
jgi:HlyD family secretion protein